MIRLEYPTVEALVKAYSDLVGEAESYLSWVGDRIGLVSRERYENGWGRVVLLAAAIGRLELVRDVAGSMLDHQASMARRALDVQRTLEGLLEDDRVGLLAEWSEQLNRSALDRLRDLADHVGILDEIHDLEVFLQDRDTIELALRGGRILLLDEEFLFSMRDADQRIRSHVERQAIPNVLRDYGTSALARLSIKWLPEDFWWRHLTTSQGPESSTYQGRIQP